ncbi:hypothetical protein N0S44_000398 [Escherichia coli]|nr:hypothetical protein [Escherichia coli]UTS53706.1 hypothetical protein UES1_339 [Escherichia phage UE-S1]
MLDKKMNTGTLYNHLKLDTFESAISTAQDIIDIIKYIKENKLKCVKTPERTMYKDDCIHVSVVNPKDKDGNRDFYNNSEQFECEYDPEFRGGFMCYSMKDTSHIEIRSSKGGIRTLEFIDIVLNQEYYFQLSLLFPAYDLGVLFMYKYFHEHWNEDFYLDLEDYQLVWEEMVELRNHS